MFKITCKLFSFVCLIILAGCDPPQNHECDPFGDCQIIGGPIYNQVDYILPVFNSINNDEIICIRSFRGNDTTSEQFSLVKVNYGTQTYQTILTNQFLIDNNILICGFDWSSTGWIVIHDCNSNQLFKVQDDRNNFQQITFGAAGFRAGYSTDGNSL